MNLLHFGEKWTDRAPHQGAGEADMTQRWRWCQGQGTRLGFGTQTHVCPTGPLNSIYSGT